MRDLIQEFLAEPVVAVVGASEQRHKFGHQVFTALLRHGRRAIPVNPNAAAVLGHPTVGDLRSLGEPVRAVSIITPPAVTEQVVEDAIAAGARILWMQPGAESPAAIRRAQDAGLEVIAGGPCVLVELASSRASG